MAQNVKMLKFDKIDHFLWKTCSSHKILNIHTDIVIYVFLRRPSTEKKIKKLFINIHYLLFFLSKAKTKNN